jgi:hypothetical protein
MPSYRYFGAAVGALLIAACAHHADPPVVAGPPLLAEPDLVVDTMDAECDGLIKAFEHWGECPNLDADDRAWIKSMIQTSQETFEAGKQGKPDEPAQHAIAIACRRGATSVKFATERCQAGPRPRID